MFLAPILLIIVIRYIRRNLQTSGLLPKWNKTLIGGIVASIVILIVEIKLPGKIYAGMFAYLILFILSWLAFYNATFRPARSIIYAALPLIVLSLANDVAVYFFRPFHAKWDVYFSASVFFAIIWMVAMLIVNKKQRKAIEKEQLKAREIERENKITEALKVKLEIEVAERTSALMTQKESLQQTLNELKSTQAHLIQSEKMASLGELTAGIAHEIQNPLNFVNNFAEVNKELIEEMVAEADKGNIAAVKIIANDIKENEEKINYHGKRADAIVKGMLQHSRNSNGIKEPIDINVLCDEYLRLSYHGLRAKDKSFNATIKTDFDNSIEKINIIPQDIGRVILNLLTNAFYAVNEKKKSFPTLKGGTNTSLNETYEPTVIVTTRKLGLSAGGPGAEITVTDNGNGIADKVLDKIFHPFFTTKPTGEGTGLGLSLSYDIVTKGHGGELKVESTEGKGTTFFIILPA